MQRLPSVRRANVWALWVVMGVVGAGPGALRAGPPQEASGEKVTQSPPDLWQLAREETSNLRFSTLFTAQNVRDHLSEPDSLERAIRWCQDTAVTHVYLETFRDGYTAKQETLTRARDRFRQAGFLVSGCITTTGLGRKSVRGWIFPCFSDTATVEKLTGVSEFTAGIFDEIMIDDFLATHCECEECIAARGDRSWSEFRRDLLRDVSRRAILEPARRVNPDVRVIIKYPQWYEDFHQRGYDVRRQTDLFEKIWVGTETRDPDNQRWGRKSQYEAYFLMRWLGEIGGEKCGGGWFDPYGTSPPTYLEQARQTVLAGAREALLFCYGSLQRDTGPANIDALRAEIPALFRLARLTRSRTVRGISAPRPPSSDARGDRYVYDFVGLLGLPLVPVSEVRSDVAAAFLAAHTLCDPELDRKVESIIARKVPLLVTRDFLEGLATSKEAVRKAAIVLDVPEDPWGLMELPEEELKRVRARLLEPFGIELEAPTRVALYLFGESAGDELIVIENFADRAAGVRLEKAASAGASLALATAPGCELAVESGATRSTVKLELPPRSLAVLEFAAERSDRAGSTALLDLGADFDVDAVGLQDAEVSLKTRGSGRVLAVRTGHRAPWPGITLKAPTGVWDLSRRTYLQVDLANVGEEPVRVNCRVDNEGTDGVSNCVTEGVALEPGRDAQITVLLRPRLFEEGEIGFIGMRGDPPVTAKVDPARITQLVIFVNRPRIDHHFEIRGIHAGGRRPPDRRIAADEFFPMIDELGQYVHADWPGKTRSLEELPASRQEETADLEASPGPANRNEFGGWTEGPQLEATGFFRVAKHAGKWWLIDPSGRLFWSHGIDCVRSSAPTPITDREHYFRLPPRSSSPFGRFYGRNSWAPHGYYSEHSPYRTYDFFQANLLRKYGDDWAEVYAELAHRRLRSWGLNTIANWSDATIYRQRRTPYVATVNTDGERLQGSKGYWRQFPDVFDRSFAASLRARLAREKGQSAGDPWCLGYFVDNELSWGDEVSLAIAALVSPPEQAAKKAFVATLRERYRTIEKLNTVWGTTHESWKELLECREPPDRTKARDDLTSFYTETAERYFSTVRDIVEEVAPNQLYLGCRFAWVNDRAARAAAKYCDIVGYNRYTYDVEGHRLPEGLDKPTIIGEFHFGALDRGLFHTGLRKARDQEHRAQLYREYVEGALRNPQIVGTHWFQYKDQPTTGRGDGENYQIGFLDVCDRPYPEIVRTCREVGERLYRYRLETGTETE